MAEAELTLDPQITEIKPRELSLSEKKAGRSKNQNQIKNS